LSHSAAILIIDLRFEVWALAISKDEKTVLSGAADSIVTFWEDCTEEQEQEEELKRTELVQKYVLSVLSTENVVLQRPRTENRISRITFPSTITVKLSNWL
jgi:WD40 repeat protein